MKDDNEKIDDQKYPDYKNDQLCHRLKPSAKPGIENTNNEKNYGKRNVSQINHGQWHPSQPYRPSEA